MKDKQRSIDRKLQTALDYFHGSKAALIKRCWELAFGTTFSPKDLRVAISRYVNKGFIARQLRKVIYCGTYRQVPA